MQVVRAAADLNSLIRHCVFLHMPIVIGSMSQKPCDLDLEQIFVMETTLQTVRGIAVTTLLRNCGIHMTNDKSFHIRLRHGEWHRGLSPYKTGTIIS